MQCTRIVALAGALLLASGAARAALAQGSYVVEDLGALAGDTSSVAQAINASGNVVGWSAGPAGTRAFIYTDADGMVALPGLAGQAAHHWRATSTKPASSSALRMPAGPTWATPCCGAAA